MVTIVLEKIGMKKFTLHFKNRQKGVAKTVRVSLCIFAKYSDMFFACTNIYAN
jgi:hypothetical protein